MLDEADEAGIACLEFSSLHRPSPEGGRMHSIARCFLLPRRIGTRVPGAWRCDKMAVGLEGWGRTETRPNGTKHDGSDLL